MPASPLDLSTAPESSTGEVIVQATTARQALEEVTAQMGPQATILEASKVRRGGIAGFFAREMVQLRACAGGANLGDASATTTTADSDSALQRLLASLSDEAEAQERTFADALRHQLATAPVDGEQRDDDEPERDEQEAPPTAIQDVAVTAEPVACPAEPVAGPVEPVTPMRTGAVDWSAAELARLGLPAAVVDALGDVDADDDPACLQRLTEALAPLCRPLPEGPAILAGPRADRLGAALGLPIRKLGDDGTPAGSFAVRLRDRLRDRDWLSWNRDGRWLHLVVGGANTWALAFDEPQAVSWVGDEGLIEALRLAVELDVALGFELAGGRGAEARRASAVDLAVAVRALLPRR